MSKPRFIWIGGTVILLTIAILDIASRRYVEANQRINIDLCFLLHNQELFAGRKFSSQALLVSDFPHGTSLVGPSCMSESHSFDWQIRNNKKISADLLTSLMNDPAVPISLRIEGEVREESNGQHLLSVMKKKMNCSRHERPRVILTSITRTDNISP